MTQQEVLTQLKNGSFIGIYGYYKRGRPTYEVALIGQIRNRNHPTAAQVFKMYANGLLNRTKQEVGRYDTIFTLKT